MDRNELKRFAAAAILIACSTILARCQAAERDSTPTQADPAIWRSAMLCGQNCMYLWARIAHKDIAYEEMLRRFPSDARGLSLTDMKSAGRAFGLDCVMARGDLKALRESPKPLVVHFEPDRPSMGPLGHYALVLDIDDEFVTCLDGSTAIISNVPPSDFLKQWTGYYLHERQSDGRWFLGASLALCGVIAFATVDRLIFRRSPRP